ncbi:RDD family protein [Devosia sp.]|uniref:RDD family protein n=1 Tax=Devosia sp. TaxID=1871048 RepID=UPI0037C08EBB
MTPNRPALPDPTTAPELFAGVLGRRVMAYIIDLALMIAFMAMLFVVGLILSIFTLGLGAVALPLIIPVVIVAYYTLTLGSPMRATVGMWMFDLVLTPTRGRPLDGWKILIHPVVFWVTVWIAWPVSLAIALFTPRREMVQDLVTGTLMVRRSPMIRHWQRVRAA